MWKILTTWTLPGTPGGTTVQYWDDEFALTTVRAKWDSLLGSIAPFLTPNTKWVVEPVAQRIQEATGELIGEEVDPTTQSGTGSAASTVKVVSNVSQLLLRWTTGVYIEGRGLRGRTNIPGLDGSLLSNGEIGSSTITTIGTSLNNWDAPNSGLGIWHRPTQGVGGSFHRINGGSVWREMAVLRKRRA